MHHHKTMGKVQAHNQLGTPGDKEFS